MAKTRTLRTQLQKYLGGLEFPATREEVVAYAREKGADDDLIDMLENMSEERFETVAEIQESLSGSEELG